MTMKGKDAHLRRLKAMSGNSMVKAAGSVLYVGADRIRSRAHVEISRGSVSGKNHVASKPGEYPNRDTGILQGHIEAAMVGPLTAQVTSSAPYAAPLEFGSSRMAARPYMRPARDIEEPEIQRLFAAKINDLVKRSGQ